MGFNIAGLVIAENFEKSITQLEDDLNWDIEVIEEITFEQASSNWTPEGEFRLFFTDKATLIFYPHEWISERYYAQNASSMSYAYSATSMTFFISYSNREEGYGRFLISNEGKVKLAEGQEIPYEKEGMSADAIIFKLIDDLIDENFHELDFGAKAYRCKKLNPSTTRLKYIKEQNQRKQSSDKSRKISAETTNHTKHRLNKKWWQFWK